MINYYTIELSDGQSLSYATLFPPDMTEGKIYPTLLALPPGEQSMAMVDWGLTQYWGRESAKRGWVVISPAAPAGKLFFQGAEALIPEFLAHIKGMYPPEGGKFHIGGISNGGRSGFQLALNTPELFHSLVVLPGYPSPQADISQLEALRDIPVRMYAGAGDSSWVISMQQTEAQLMALGVSVSLQVMLGEGHVIQQLMGGQHLFDVLDSLRR